MAFSRTTLTLALVVVLVGSALAQGPALAPSIASTPTFAPLATPPVASSASPPVTAVSPAQSPTVATPELAPSTPTIDAPTGSPTVPETDGSPTSTTSGPAPAPESEKSGAFVHGSNLVALVVFGGVAAFFA